MGLGAAELLQFLGIPVVVGRLLDRGDFKTGS
jgi:hypothetical protein